MQTLADIYKVRARFQRSTRIDDDFGDASALGSQADVKRHPSRCLLSGAKQT